MRGEGSVDVEAGPSSGAWASLRGLGVLIIVGAGVLFIFIPTAVTVALTGPS